MAEDPFCWEIRKCPPEQRNRCNAYRAKKNCWEVAYTCFNSPDRLRCENCPVLLLRTARLMAAALGGH